MRVALSCRGSFKWPSPCTISPQAIARAALSVMRRAARNLALAKDHAFGVRIDRLRAALNDWIHALEHHGNPQAPKIEFLRDASSRNLLCSRDSVTRHRAHLARIAASRDTADPIPSETIDGNSYARSAEAICIDPRGRPRCD